MFIWFYFFFNPCRYEAVFYAALALALMAWILFENANLYISQTSISTVVVVDDLVQECSDKYLQLSDMRIPLTFVSDKFISIQSY